MLETRLAEQRAVLDEGASLVKPGRWLAYITCSVLPQENTAQIASFLERHADFEIVPWRETWSEAISEAPPDSADASDDTLLMTPRSHGTDGFFVAVL